MRKDIQQLTIEHNDLIDRIKKVEIVLNNLHDNNSLLLDLLPYDLMLSIKTYCEELLNTDLDFQKQTDTELNCWIDSIIDDVIHDEQNLKEELD